MGNPSSPILNTNPVWSSINVLLPIWALSVTKLYKSVSSKIHTTLLVDCDNIETILYVVPLFNPIHIPTSKSVPSYWNWTEVSSEECVCGKTVNVALYWKA